MTDLTDLEIEDLERTDNGTIGHHASFVAADGVHVAVFDVTGAESRNAVWVRVFGGNPSDPSNEVLLNGHISETVYDGPEDIPKFVRDAVVCARISELGQPLEQAAF